MTFFRGRVGKFHYPAFFRSRQFCFDERTFFALHFYRITIGFGNFGFMRKFHFTLFGQYAKLSNLWHNRNIPVITHPNRWLMGGNKSMNGGIFINIRHCLHFILPCLCRKIGHGKRGAYPRHGSPLTFGRGTNQRVYCISFSRYLSSLLA
ncbi:hypothetical protein D3C87_1358670 [compost metagenome]